MKTLLDLDAKVFGSVSYKEVIGETPTLEVFEKILKEEFDKLIKQTSNISYNELKNIIQHQIRIEKQVNSKLGAMALSQSKIKKFTEFNRRFIDNVQNSFNHF